MSESEHPCVHARAQLKPPLNDVHTHERRRCPVRVRSSLKCRGRYSLALDGDYSLEGMLSMEGGDGISAKTDPIVSFRHVDRGMPT